MDNYTNKIKIIYNNENIEIDAILRISDCNVLGSVKQFGDYKLVVANIISRHSNRKLSYEEIYSIDDSIIDNIIEAFVRSDKLLTRNYEIVDVVDKYEKFILSIEKTRLDYSKKFSETINKTLSLNNMAERLHFGISKQLEPLKQIQMEYSNYIKRAMKSWSLYNRQFEDLISNISKSIKNIKIPSIIEEDKEKLFESYSEFGKFRWTIPLFADLNTFNKAPHNGEEAYRIVKKYINENNIEKLFNELLQIPRIKKSDINEAIECFKNRHYKACSLIIFSLIDAKLIRSQPKKIEDKKYRRPVGMKAVKKLFKNIEINYIEEAMFIKQLYQANILEALKTIFKDGDDFKNQPSTINRNFIAHGMMHRKVYRKDCVMLFLLLFNFYQYINIFIEY